MSRTIFQEAKTLSKQKMKLKKPWPKLINWSHKMMQTKAVFFTFFGAVMASTLHLFSNLCL